MDYQLTLPTILRRAETFFGKKEIISRLPDKSIHRYTYQDFARRTKKLAVPLRQLGIQQGDRVATLSWNHHQHLEAYFAVPCMGAVVHPLNLRFNPEDLSYIINHAEDKLLIVDQRLHLRRRFQVREGSQGHRPRSQARPVHDAQRRAHLYFLR